MALVRWVGRAIGLDVHRDFCVVAICEDGRVRSAGRVPSTPEGLRLLAESLLATDRVALEVTASCWEVVRILEPFVDRVTVVSPDDTGISSARRRLTSSTPAPWRCCCGRARSIRSGCRMTAAGSAPTARAPRAARARALARQERDLSGAGAPADPAARVRGPVRRDGPPVAGRGAAASRGARVCRRGSAADRVPRRGDQGGREADRPAGVGLAGDPPVDDGAGREPSAPRRSSPRSAVPTGFSPTAARRVPRLYPKVRQSGETPARSGRISKRGSASARWALVEAACSVVSNPARYARSTNGSAPAVVTGRRSSRPPHSRSSSGSSVWRDYAHQRPALPRRARELELTAVAKPRRRPPPGSVNQPRDPRRRTALTEQAEISYKRMSPTSKPSAGEKWRERDTGARINQALNGKAARQHKAPDVCTSLRQSPAPTRQPTVHCHAYKRRDSHNYANSAKTASIPSPPTEPSPHEAISSPARPATRPIGTPKNAPRGLDFHRRRTAGWW